MVRPQTPKKILIQWCNWPWKSQFLGLQTSPRRPGPGRGTTGASSRPCSCPRNLNFRSLGQFAKRKPIMGLLDLYKVTRTMLLYHMCLYEAMLWPVGPLQCHFRRLADCGLATIYLIIQTCAATFFFRKITWLMVLLESTQNSTLNGLSDNHFRGIWIWASRWCMPKV